MPKNETIMLKNVRLSFPSLFQTEKFGGEDTGKYGCTLMLDKSLHAKEIDALQKKINGMIQTELKVSSIPENKRCLKNGDETGRPEYAGHYVLRATSKKRPTVVDKDKSPLVESDDRPYPGCYVNALIGLWVQNNSFGKRINANIHGVQFARDGEPFGESIDVTEEFDVVEDVEDVVVAGTDTEEF